ncbi:trace amine-associated receptor 1-like [Cyprinodon tularosa]|uniref:trace amine-associated receptor 1-like n=1 Tax=Cyprinodon tularosa TaxID=77115 RepID=UPI0018E27AF9|nr:trace amine-associated receptor 1-like [Cyprinodon tularosa]
MIEDQRLCNESSKWHGQTVTTYALYVVFASLSLLIISGNLLVITSIIYFKQLHTPTNFLILSLAVSDLLVGALVLPFSSVLSMSSCWYSTHLPCKIRGLFDMLLSVSSILNLCFISVDRYYVVCHPLTYRNKINVRVSLILILVSWTFHLLLAVIITFRRIGLEDPSRRCKIFSVTKESITGSYFAFYIPAIIFLIIYLKILVVAKKQARRIQKTLKISVSVSQMEKKANITLAIVVGVFFMCWTPYFLSISFYGMYKIKTPDVMVEIFKWIGWSNSMLNPLVYAFFYKWFRRAFKMIIQGKLFQGDFSNTNLF